MIEKEYIEKILRRKIEIAPYKEQYRLSLVLRNRFQLYCIKTDGEVFLAAEPAEGMSLSVLRNDYRQLEVLTEQHCALYMKHMTYYSCGRMVDEGIPFIWEGHQLYLPFLGILLGNGPRRVLPAVHQISFLTQKLLLTALYETWDSVTVTEASAILGVSKMSASRSFDEIEALDIPYLIVQKRRRVITADPDRRRMWKTILPVLRNPVIRIYYRKKRPDAALPLSGLSALAQYSLLDDGATPVFAVTKKNLKDAQLSSDSLTPAGENPGCIIQKLGYWISYEDGHAVDPLTVLMTLTERERDDPRASMAVDEMLEEKVW